MRYITIALSKGRLAKKALEIFEHIGITCDEMKELEIAENKSKRANSSFKLLNIAVGEKISFLYDDNIEAEVIDEKNHI